MFLPIDQSLQELGRERVEWIRSRMNLLAGVCSAFEESKPFAGRTIGVSFHIEPKTVVLLETLAAGRARIVGASNYGWAQDDMVAMLRAQGVEIFGPATLLTTSTCATSTMSFGAVLTSCSRSSPTSTPPPSASGSKQSFGAPLKRRRPEATACGATTGARSLRAVFHMAGFIGEEAPLFEIRDAAGPATDLLISNPGGVRANSRAVPAVLASAHEQSVPIFQQLARSHPSGRDDLRAIPAVAAQRRGSVGGARDRHQPRDRPVLLEPVWPDVRRRDS